MTEVLITDQHIPSGEAEEYFRSLDQWAKDACEESYQGYEVVDVSDFSYNYDQVGAFKFTNQKHAEWFYLAHGKYRSSESR